MSEIELASEHLVELAGDIVAAYVSKNALSPADLPKLIGGVYVALAGLGHPPVALAAPPLKPVVPVRKSVTPDYLICLDDGKRFKSLKRHLAALGMTPEQYRAKWHLPPDYPMVAPSYSEIRSQLARSNGLGRQAGKTMPARRRRAA